MRRGIRSEERKAEKEKQKILKKNAGSDTQRDGGIIEFCINTGDEDKKKEDALMKKVWKASKGKGRTGINTKGY